VEFRKQLETRAACRFCRSSKVDVSDVDKLHRRASACAGRHLNKIVEQRAFADYALGSASETSLAS
jgi:hypothetical protein